MNQQNNNIPLATANWQGCFGLLRVFWLFVLIAGFAAFAGVNFHGVVPGEVAAQYRLNSPGLFGWWPEFALRFFALIVNKYSLRYIIPPLLAVVTVMVAAAKYITDLYNLDSFSTAIWYIIATMFTIRYPSIRIDKGKLNASPRITEQMNKIGGPGFVLVEPGSAAIFRRLRRPGQTVLPTAYFLAPFEQIAFPIDLDEQQCKKDEIRTVTRDGIQVLLSDIHIRYRILQKNLNGVPRRRTLDDPFPLAQDALDRMMRNLSVDENHDLDPWTVAVERFITGELMDFVASHPIDFLTAPRKDSSDPRLEMRSELFSRNIRDNLARNYGAELIWMDVGHIEIIEPVVDDQRTSMWAADWVGSAGVERAYGEAQRLAYQELGRAEAQAELIMGISEALREVDLSGDSKENVRKIFLARTAQILDAMNARNETNRGKTNDRLS